MTRGDFERFAKALVILGESMDVSLTEGRIHAYFAALQDLGWDRLEYAIGEAIATCRFFPKPVELRELAVGRVEDDAEAAWGRAIDEARRVGSYGTPALPDAVASTVRAVFGDWRAFCACEVRGPEGIGWRKQFVQAYEVYARREQAQERALSHGEAVAALADVRERAALTAGKGGDRRAEGDV